MRENSSPICLFTAATQKLTAFSAGEISIIATPDCKVISKSYFYVEQKLRNGSNHMLYILKKTAVLFGKRNLTNCLI